jgi:DNA repair exonuclease SbcCD ATPase subunit
MIKLESVHIEEMRGIRSLDLDFRKSTFAISGPNGSGKSGVIDAIEFALTGQISRLMGRGTKALSVAEHGPHVDKVKFPAAALVRVKVFLTDLGKSATVTRNVKTSTPADADIREALTEVAAHPEIALSRREILRFILVEPTKRSEEIQTILKLDDIGQVRSALNGAQNKLQTALKIATSQVKSSRDALLMHLQLPSLNSEAVLVAVNKRRVVLALPDLAELTSDTKLDERHVRGRKRTGIQQAVGNARPKGRIGRNPRSYCRGKKRNGRNYGGHRQIRGGSGALSCRARSVVCRKRT